MKIRGKFETKEGYYSEIELSPTDLISQLNVEDLREVYQIIPKELVKDPPTCTCKDSHNFFTCNGGYIHCGKCGKPLPTNERIEELPTESTEYFSGGKILFYPAKVVDKLNEVIRVLNKKG